MKKNAVMLKKFIESLDEKPVQKIPALENVDIVVSAKLNLKGVVLKKEILVYNYKEIYSFRVKPENILISKEFRFIKSKKNFDKDFLESYFEANNDNPFAIENILTQFLRSSDINEVNIITQFPPLRLIKDPEASKIKFNELIEKAQTGDLIMTFDRTSYLSQKIRKIDFSQWTHGFYVFDGKEKIVQDMTTSGWKRYHLSEVDFMNTDIALFRIDKPDIPMDFFKILLDDSFKHSKGYNWNGVIRIYLARKYRLLRFLKKAPSGSDLSYGNSLILLSEV